MSGIDGTTEPNKVALKWEYKVIELRLYAESRLDELGKEGWELVTVENNIAYLKKPYWG